MTFFSGLSGYTTTLLYKSIQRDLCKFDTLQIQKISKSAAIVNQAATLIGSLCADFFIVFHLYHKTVLT